MSKYWDSKLIDSPYLDRSKVINKFVILSSYTLSNLDKEGAKFVSFFFLVSSL